MDQELEVVAKNEAEAIERALAEAGLNADEVEAEAEAIGKNSKGFLGLVAAKEKKYLVRIRKQEEEGGKSERKKLENGSDEAREQAEQLLREALELMKMNMTVSRIEEDEEAIKIEMEGEDSGILIGRRGQTLDAFQYWLNVAMHRKVECEKRVVLDVEEYRVRQRSELEHLAKRTAEQATERQMSMALRPMSAYERRIVHVTLQDSEDVETVSEGEEPDRKVLIVPKQ